MQMQFYESEIGDMIKNDNESNNIKQNITTSTQKPLLKNS